MRVSFTLIIILIFGCTKSDSDFDENLSKEGSYNFEYFEVYQATIFNMVV